MKFLILLLSSTFSLTPVNAMEIDYNLEFGLVLQDKHGEPIGFKETTTIPIENLGEHSLYGLILSKDSEEVFTVGSVHILPKEHHKVEKIMGRTMTISGKGAVFMKTQPNDIPGNYAMEVYINGALYKTIEYKLLSSM